MQTIRMSIVENYRSSSDYREILRILQKSTTLQENFLWQSNDEGKNVIPLHHFEIDFLAREVVVVFDQKRYQLNPNLPIYIKLDYRTSVFKVTEYSARQNSIHFGFPKEIKTLELRGNSRIPTHPDKIKTVSLKPTLTGLRDTGHELQVRVIDISQNGLGLLISEQNRAFLKNNRILWVTQMGEEKLRSPVLGEVVYMNSDFDPKYQTKRQKELKVGLKLSGILPQDIYYNFIQ